MSLMSFSLAFPNLEVEELTTTILLVRPNCKQTDDKKWQIRFCKYHEKMLNLMQIHLYEVKILQIHNARPEFVKDITAINQSESSILI